MTEELAVYKTDQVNVIELGKTLASSNYFADAKNAAQATVKVLAGQEFGIGPVTSMTGIHIIQGKPSVGANLMAAVVKRSDKYDFRVKTLTDTEAVIEFFERNGDGWGSLGVSTFTKADAAKAKTQNMDKYPRNMLYARAMSNGVKWYCPDVFMAPIYTPDELGADVNWETGEIVDMPAPAPTPQPSTGGNGTPDYSKELAAFTASVLDAIPYYNHEAHVKNTLKKLGHTSYKPDKEAEMRAALEQHASEKADAEAGDAEQETLNLGEMVNG